MQNQFKYCWVAGTGFRERLWLKLVNLLEILLLTASSNLVRYYLEAIHKSTYTQISQVFSLDPTHMGDKRVTSLKE